MNALWGILACLAAAHVGWLLRGQRADEEQAHDAETIRLLARERDAVQATNRVLRKRLMHERQMGGAS